MLAARKPIEIAESIPFMTLTQNVERRKHRRHDLSDQDLPVYAVIDGTPADTAVGTLKDLSSGGVRFTTLSGGIGAGTQISLHLSLPPFAGIRAFIDKSNEQPATEWQGTMSVTRVIRQDDGSYEVAGRLLELSDGERGMLGLYLSTQPLAG